MQIPAYRDPECQWTIKDMHEKAKNPERIFTGICWQFIKEKDNICFQQPSPRPEQVRVTGIDTRESKGVCWARAKALRKCSLQDSGQQAEPVPKFEDDQTVNWLL